MAPDPGIRTAPRLPRAPLCIWLAGGAGPGRRRCAAATIAMSALLVIVLPSAALLAADAGRPSPAAADIELRKSVRRTPRPGPQGPPQAPARGERGSASGSAAGDSAGARLPARLSAAAAAVGEPLRTSGTLHLPDVGGREIDLDGGRHPVLEYGTGRRAIFDPERALSPGIAAGIAGRWPGYTVLQPAPEADARALLAQVLEASGYASVARSTPVTLGRGVTVRLVPDFVILKADRDLLDGETLLISVVEPAEALPPELRELAAGHRIRTVEIDGDGASVGSDRAPWAEPSGRLTTMEVRRPWLVLAEVAAAVGLSVDRKAALPPGVDGAPGRIGARVGNAAGSALILAAPPGPAALAELERRGETPIVVSETTELPAAIRALLARFGMAAIGPTVELFRAPRPGAAPRFTLVVPGWLVETGGRRLLITGAGPQALVKRYLGREAIDLLEYRVREQ